MEAILVTEVTARRVGDERYVEGLLSWVNNAFRQVKHFTHVFHKAEVTSLDKEYFVSSVSFTVQYFTRVKRPSTESWDYPSQEAWVLVFEEIYGLDELILSFFIYF